MSHECHASEHNNKSSFCSTAGQQQRKQHSLALLAFCEGKPPVTSEFPSKRASNVEDVPISWRHLAIQMLLSSSRADCVDTASWCSTMPISDCYVSAHTCCDTCRRNYDPSKKCESLQSKCLNITVIFFSSSSNVMWYDMKVRTYVVVFKGLRPVLEGFVVTMHEGACETGSQVPRAIARGIWRTVRTSPSALWQQTPTDRS